MFWRFPIWSEHLLGAEGGGCIAQIKKKLKKLQFFLIFNGFQVSKLYKFGIYLFMNVSPIDQDVQICVYICFLHFMSENKIITMCVTCVLNIKRALICTSFWTSVFNRRDMKFNLLFQDPLIFELFCPFLWISQRPPLPRLL